VTIFILIWLSYTLIAYNTRAVARGEYLSTMVTDALIAVVGFFLVKEIVVGGMGDLARYVAGAMAGGASGIWLSKRAGHSTMKLLPSESQAAQEAAAAWKRTYYHGDKWAGYAFNPETVYNRLVALPVGATAADVAAIIGNDSWVGVTCDDCRTERAVVQVGAEPAYESPTANLCATCVRTAFSLITTEKPPQD
jgi:hypothetical protein